ncbi:MAG: hypothetical protein AB8B83_06315 [Bdellovibrionales bacterium]
MLASPILNDIETAIPTVAGQPAIISGHIFNRNRPEHDGQRLESWVLKSVEGHVVTVIDPSGEKEVDFLLGSARTPEADAALLHYQTQRFAPYFTYTAQKQNALPITGDFLCVIDDWYYDPDHNNISGTGYGKSGGVFQRGFTVNTEPLHSKQGLIVTDDLGLAYALARPAAGQHPHIKQQVLSRLIDNDPRDDIDAIIAGISPGRQLG